MPTDPDADRGRQVAKPWRHRLRDGGRARLRPLRARVAHFFFGRLRSLSYRLRPRGRRLHVGCGARRLEGWVNIDRLPLPEVDLVRDATASLGPFREVRAVYAEHFLEHLDGPGALSFLGLVRRVLAADGRLRLSTPNLEWVWTTQYRREATPEEKVEQALAVNRCFYGWGHRVLWNRELLERALGASGFRGLRWYRYGESDDPLFDGIEGHETYPDEPALPHVLVVEAAKGEPDPAALAALRADFERELERYR